MKETVTKKLYLTAVKSSRVIMLMLGLIAIVQLDAQQMNQYGHITLNDVGPDFELLEDHGHIHVSYNDAIFEGSTVIELSSGFATLTNTCGNTPPTISIYTADNTLREAIAFDQTINIRSDLSKRYLYFKNNKKWTILDTETFEVSTVSVSHDISVMADGSAIYYDDNSMAIVMTTQAIEIDFIPRAIEVDKYDNVYVFGKEKWMLISADQLTTNEYKDGSLYEVVIDDGHVHWVEKKIKGDFNYYTHYSLQSGSIKKLDSVSFDRIAVQKPISNNRNRGQDILCPMFPDSTDYPFRVGNSYAEHQKYGGTPYLHPGIDLLGFPDQEIYAPVGGVVKAVLTTGSFIYWRLALGLEDTDDTQEGYLFAHLDPATIPFTIGDRVQAGDYIGSIVEWPVADFHHLHFARLQHQGEIWDGNWLTKDNVLADITNFKDESAPVFENIFGDETIGFRSDNGVDFLFANELRGSFDIVCRAYDLSNDTWRLDVNSLWYELIDLDTDEVVFEQDAFTYDFVLDVYASSQNTTEILETIYSTFGPWESEGNYDRRHFFQQVSRSNGDGVIDANDKSHYFDSTMIPDGSYLLRIYADDAVGNQNSTEIVVRIANLPASTSDELNTQIEIFPNPSNGKFQVDAKDTFVEYYEIVNTLGQVVKVKQRLIVKQTNFSIEEAGIYLFNGYDANHKQVVTRKLVVD